MRKAMGVMQMCQTRQLHIDEDACIKSWTDELTLRESRSLQKLRWSVRGTANPEVVGSIWAQIQKTENSYPHGFNLHRPSSKGTKLLFQVINPIINQLRGELWDQTTLSKHFLVPVVGSLGVATRSGMMMVAFITFNSSLVLLIEGLCTSNPWEFQFSGFKRNRWIYSEGSEFLRRVGGEVGISGLEWTNKHTNKPYDLERWPVNKSDSFGCLARMNTSEEMAQARDTSKHVTFML